MADGPGDQLLLTVNDTVGTFERVNFNPFSLEMIGVERVVVTGQGGDDSLTVAQSGPISAFGAIHFTGGSAQDSFFGDTTTSRNFISGGDGDDVIISGSGNDFSLWVNGDGSDNVIGGDGNDAQRFNMADGPGDEVTLSGDTGVATFARTNFNEFSVTMQQVERVVVSGLDADDIITLDNAEDGGIFSVNFAGGNGQDQVLTDSSTTVRVIANGGEGDDQLNGGAANDVLIGCAGQDNLVGNDGRDRLLGQAGDDTLTGGAGRNTFVFTPGSNNDTITDFEIGQDIIRYNLATFVFDDLNISASGGDLWIATPEGDSITLVGLAEETLTSADFMIVT